MTTHEFANKLLAGPDIPCAVPPVQQYDLDDKFVYEPATSIVKGWDTNDTLQGITEKEILIISYRKVSPFSD